MRRFISSVRRIILFLLSFAILETSVVFPTYAGGCFEKTGSRVISDSLALSMNDNPNETFKVIIWLEDINCNQAVDQALNSIPDYYEKLEMLKNSSINSREDADEWRYIISVRREAMRSCYETYSCSFARNNLESDELIYSSIFLPVVIARLCAERIRAIASTEGVVSIDNYCDDIIDEIPERESDPQPGYYQMWDNIEFVNADGFEDEWGTNGYGIRVGILDEGIPDTTLSMFFGGDITVRYSSTEATVGVHPTNVLKIAYRTAFDASFFCTTFWNTNINPTPTLVGELEWLIANYVDVINISARLETFQGAGPGGTDGNNDYGAIAKLLDCYVCQYDITIVESAGNEGTSGIASGGMGYNVITVGNFYRYGNSISSDSSYNDGSFSGFADKPDICAPGYVLFDDMTCDSGTSYSASLVTGVVALLMACRGSFRISPERVKAVLTASVTMNTHHYLPDTSDYHQYGAGLIDAARASDIAANMDYIDDSMVYNVSGVDFEEDFYSSTTVRISLVFEKYISGSNVVYNLADLDLLIFDPSDSCVAWSATPFNNVEIVEFSPSVFGTYTIRIQNYGPATYFSSYHNTEYSVSWIQE